jgi:biotin carboxylase
VRKEFERHDYAVVLPTSDAALIALDAPVRHLLDKAACSRRAHAAGIPVAPGRVFTDTDAMRAAAEELDYPLVVKPAIKRSLAVRVDDAAALRGMPNGEGEMIVQPFIDGPMTAVAGVVWKGELVAAVHMAYERIWPLPCGTVASARTVEPNTAIEDCLLRVLEGYDGPFHAEFLGPYLQDLNPRLHGTLPLAVASGVNLAAIHCDLVRGLAVAPARGATGVFFRWIEGDVRSIAKSMRTGTMPPGQALRALAPRRHVIHSYESLRDPGPMLTRLRYARRRLAGGMKAARPLRATVESGR